MSHVNQICFNCQRSEDEIPVISWKYQGQALWVCSECMPSIIHKWPQVVARMEQQKEELSHQHNE